jgi:hypothetical protein
LTPRARVTLGKLRVGQLIGQRGDRPSGVGTGLRQALLSDPGGLLRAGQVLLGVCDAAVGLAYGLRRLPMRVGLGSLRVLHLPGRLLVGLRSRLHRIGDAALRVGDLLAGLLGRLGGGVLRRGDGLLRRLHRRRVGGLRHRTDSAQRELLQRVSDDVGISRAGLEALIDQAERRRTVEPELAELGAVLVHGVEQVAGLVVAVLEPASQHVEALLRARHQAGTHHLADRGRGAAEILIERVGQRQHLLADAGELRLAGVLEDQTVLDDALDRLVYLLHRVAEVVGVHLAGGLPNVPGGLAGHAELRSQLVRGLVDVHRFLERRADAPRRDAAGEQPAQLLEVLADLLAGALELVCNALGRRAGGDVLAEDVERQTSHGKITPVVFSISAVSWWTTRRTGARTAPTRRRSAATR